MSNKAYKIVIPSSEFKRLKRNYKHHVETDLLNYLEENFKDEINDPELRIPDYLKQHFPDRSYFKNHMEKLVWEEED